MDKEEPICHIGLSGDKAWYLNGNLHREDGPAVEWVNGYKVWYLHGNLHREDGPAIEWEDGRKEFWINEENFSEEEFIKYQQLQRLRESYG